MASVHGEGLSRGGKAAVSIIALAAMVFVAGWAARGTMIAEAAEVRADRVERIEKTVNKLDKNMARVMDRLDIKDRE